MTEQARIDDRGLLTWDGEPMFCPETVAEYRQAGLFDSGAFDQMPGQLAIGWEPPCGSAECRLRECCMSRDDCQRGIGDE